MLVVTDIGNTHTVFGIFDGEELLGRWRVVSATHRTPDEYAAFVTSLFTGERIPLEKIDAAILGSVVPQLTRVWIEIWKGIAGVKALVVEPGIKTGLDMKHEDTREVGADRIVNAVAGIAKIGAPLIIVDFGTATTLDVCLEPNIYLGGMIAPGVELSLGALSARAALLPNVEIKPPDVLIGKNTVSAILSGTVYGNAALVEGLINRVWSEIGTTTPVAVTGGLGRLFYEQCELLTHYEPNLTLEGLRLLHELNTPA